MNENEQPAPEANSFLAMVAAAKEESALARQRREWFENRFGIRRASAAPTNTTEERD